MTAPVIALLVKALTDAGALTTMDLEQLEDLDPQLKTAAADRRMAALQAAWTAPTSPAQKRGDAWGALIVTTIKKSLDRPLARIATLEARQQALTDELQTIRDQLVNLMAEQATRAGDRVR
jgi:hypothetical protein